MNVERRFHALTTVRGLVMSTNDDGKPDIAKVAAALAKAQGEFRAVPKAREVEVRMKSGGKYKFQYAELQDILAMVRRPLAENELSLVFGVENLAGKASVSATLLHSSGQYMQATITGAYGNDIKELGGTVSYLRRYAVQSVLGIATGDESIAVEGRGEDDPEPPPQDVRHKRTAAEVHGSSTAIEERNRKEAADTEKQRIQWINDTLSKRGLSAEPFRHFIAQQGFPTRPGAWQRYQMEFFSLLLAEMERAEFDFAEVEIWLGGSQPLGKLSREHLVKVGQDIASDGWPSNVREANRQALGAAPAAR